MDPGDGSGSTLASVGAERSATSPAGWTTHGQTRRRSNGHGDEEVLTRSVLRAGEDEAEISVLAIDRSVLRHATVLGILSGLATATQLRSAGAAGPFDLAIILYSAIVLLRNRPRLAAVQTRVGLFLTLFVLLGGVGGLVSVFVGQGSLSKVAFGLLPYLFALVSLEMASSQATPSLYLRRWLFLHGVVVLGTQLGLLAAYHVGMDNVGSIVLYIGERGRTVRFLGWTNNPNQLAMVSTLATCALVLSARRPHVRALAFVAGLTLGAATGSDGFRVGLGVGFVALAVVVLSGRATVRPLVRILMWTGAAGLAVVVALSYSSIIDSISTTADDGDQAEERFVLWASCFPTIEASPLVGMGPGSHGSLRGEPRSCHNTYVEGATFAGLPVMLFLAWTLAHLFRLQVQRGELLGLTLLVLGAVQMVFSFFFRYPQLWMLFLGLEVGARAIERRERARDQVPEGELEVVHQ